MKNMGLNPDCIRDDLCSTRGVVGAGARDDSGSTQIAFGIIHVQPRGFGANAPVPKLAFGVQPGGLIYEWCQRIKIKTK